MKVAAITGERSCEILERPRPSAAADFAVVRVTAIPMCTEFKMYRDGVRSVCLGHEAAGAVVEVAQPGRVSVGDRVVVMPQYPCGVCDLCMRGDYIHCEHTVDPLAVCGCETGRATYAEYLLKQDWLLLPIPDDVSDDHASMACCGLGPTFAAMQRMQVGAFDTVLIMGLGPVGLGGVINATHRGARVVGADPNPYRRELAERMGASLVVDPTAGDALKRVRQELPEGMPSCAVDCAGLPESQRFAVDALARRGRLSFVGEAAELTLHVSRDLIRKGLSLHGVWHWNLCDAPLMMQTIRANRDKLDLLVTHRFPLTDVQHAWELQLTGQCGKVVLHC